MPSQVPRLALKAEVTKDSFSRSAGPMQTCVTQAAPAALAAPSIISQGKKSCSQDKNTNILIPSHPRTNLYLVQSSSCHVSTQEATFFESMPLGTVTIWLSTISHAPIPQTHPHTYTRKRLSSDFKGLENIGWWENACLRWLDP